MNKFAERLRELRLNENLTQEDLAKRCGTSTRNISYWECGLHECNFDMLLTLSNIFDCTTDYLLGKTDF